MKNIFRKINNEDTKKMISIFLVVSIFISPLSTLFFYRKAEAAFNKEINYQGKLTTSASIAVPNGSYNMEFKLYTISTGGSAIWTETRTSGDRVVVANGLFSLMLGEISSLAGVNFNQLLYLGVNIGGTNITPSWDGEMTPRKKLGAVPAAIEAQNAAKASSLVGGNSTTLLGSVPYQSDTDTTSMVAPNTTTTRKFFRMAGDGTNGAIPIWDTLTSTDVGLGNVTNESKATMFTSPTFTGTVAGFTMGGTLALGANTLTTTNATVIANLNADLLDGHDTSYFQTALTNPITGTGTDHYLAKFNGTTALENSLLFDNGTNVGIGTTTPTKKLEIQAGTPTSGATDFGLKLKGSYATSNWTGISFGATHSDNFTKAGIIFQAREGTNLTGDIIFLNNNTASSANVTTTDAKMVIQASGNVGIGTTTPISKLDVAGTLTVENGTVAGGLIQFGTGVVPVLQGNDAGTLLTLNGSGYTNVSINGNVGIGTTAPGSLLHVYGSGSIIIDSSAGTDTAMVPLLRYYRLGVQKAYVGYDSTGDTDFTTYNGIGNLKYRADTGSIIFNTNSEAMRILNNGNVGIGTTSPDQLLTLAATNPYLHIDASAAAEIMIDRGSANRNSEVQYQTAGVLKWVTGLTDSDTGMDGSQFFIGQSTGGAGANMVIQTDGNVGIGTTAPTVALDVSSATGVIFRRTASPSQYTSFLNDSNYNSINFSTAGSKTTLIANSSNLTDTAGTPMIISAGNTVNGTTIPDLSGGNLILQSGVGTGTGASTISFKTGTTLSTNLGVQTLSEKMTILGNGNVGIGTNAPGAKLDVRLVGDGTTGTYFLRGGSQNYRMLGISENTADNGIILDNAYTGGAGYMAFRTNAGSGIAERMRINTAGNIGIGTTAPNKALEVNSTLESIAAFTGGVANATWRYSMISIGQTHDNSGQFGRMTHQTDATLSGVFINNYGDAEGTTGMFIKKGGNVGIGTTAPSVKLHVAETGLFGAVIIENSAATGATLSYPQLKLRGTGSADAHLDIDRSVTGRMAVTTYSTAGVLDWVSGMYYNGGNAQSNFGIGTSKNAVDQKLVIDKSTGNVGIGTTAPSQKLEVNNASSGAVTRPLVVSNSAGGNNSGAAIDFQLESSWFPTSLIATRNTAGESTFDIQTYAASKASRLFINTSGNVGIGTTAPDAKLDVLGSARFQGYLAPSTGAGVEIGYGSIAGQGEIFSINRTASTFQPLRIRGNGIYLMEGNVGIGTAAPDSLFHIKKTTAAAKMTIESSDSYPTYTNYSAGSDEWSLGFDKPNNAFIFANSDAINSTGIAMVIKSGGNVGIGTTLPTTGKLQVDTFNASNNALTIQASNQTSRTYGIGIDTGSNLSIYDNTAALARMVISSTGNVGIGTTNPVGKFEVRGTASQDALDVYTTTTGAGNSAIYASHSGAVVTGSGKAYGGFIEATGASTINYGLATNASGAVTNYGLYVTASSGTTNYGVYSALGTNYFNGNVGIGTTAPGYLLDVNGTARVGFTTDGVQNLVFGGVPVSANGDRGRIWYDGANTDMRFDTESTGQNIVLGSYNAGANNEFLTILGSTGNVGIGTTNPSEKLEVNGNIMITAGASGAIKTGANDLYLDPASNNTTLYDGSSAMVLNIYNGTTNNIKLNSNGNSWLNATTGNVGIGTTAPAAKLDVQGSDTTAYVSSSASATIPAGGLRLNIQNTGSAASSFTGLSFVALNGSNAIGYLDFINTATTSGDFVFGQRTGVNSYAEQMRITNTGNVGIGTTTPLAQLHTVGLSTTSQRWGYNSASNDAIYNLQLNQVVTAGNVRWSFDQRNANVDYPNILVFNQGNVGIGTTGPGGKLDVSVANSNIALRLTATGISAVGQTVGDISFFDIADNNEDARIAAVVENSYGSGLAFSTKNGTSSAGFASEKMRILGNGNVGIGTTVPGAKLDVFTGTNSTDTGAALGSGIRILSGSTAKADAYLNFWASSNTTASSYGAGRIHSGWDLSSGALWTDSYIAFQTHSANNSNWTDDMIIKAGNVGIGSTNPLTPLHIAVAGTTDLSIDDTSNTTGRWILRAGQQDHNDFSIGQKIGAGTYTPRMLISGSGNVGIGTTNPLAKLQVENAGVVAININDGSSSQIPTINFQQGGVTKAFIEGGVSLSSRMDLGIAAARVMTLTATGVGIGETAPGSKLSVKGGMTVGNDVAYSQIAAPADGMIIKGNVGIGTTGPGNTLSVLGAVANDGAPSLTDRTKGIASFITPTATSGVQLNIGGYTASPYAIWLQASYSATNGAYPIVFNPLGGNVGIGTTNPGAKLHIYGGDEDTLKLDASTGEPAVLFAQAGTNRWEMRAGSGALGFYDYVNATWPWYMLNGNMGIGTTAPTANLQVAQGTAGVGTVSNTAGGTTVTGVGTQFINTFNIGDTITIGGQTVAISAIASDTSMTTAAITNANTTVAYTLVGGDRFVVKGNGRVGIGTTAPGAKLDVGGVFQFTNSGVLNWGASSANGTLTWDTGYAKVMAQGTNTLKLYSGSSGIDVITGGNVGIGTTSPDQLLTLAATNPYLHIDASAAAEIMIDRGSANRNSEVQYQTAGVLKWVTGLTDSDTGMDGSQFFIGQSTGGAGANMVIQTDGNVGIGTTGPQYKLHLYGTEPIIQLEASTNTGTNGLRMLDLDGTTAWQFGRNFALTDNSLEFRYGSQMNMVIQSGGNVGIGTTSPGSLLTVAGNVEVGNSIGRTTGGTLNIRPAGINSDGGQLSLTTGGVFQFNTNAGVSQVIFNNGNVGIGTTAPARQLSVIASSGNGSYFGHNINDGVIVGYSQSGAGVSEILGINEAISAYNDLSIRASSGVGSGLYLKTGGNVGIGTTAPGAKLHVNGHCVTGDTLLPIRRRKKKKNSAEVDEEDGEEDSTDGNIGKNQNAEIDTGWDYLMVPIIDILPGDEVLSLNKYKGKVEYHPIKGLMDMGVKDVYELRTKSGRVIRTTANHPYLVKLREKKMEEEKEKILNSEQKSATQKLTNIIKSVGNYITDSNDGAENSENRDILTPQARDMNNIIEQKDYLSKIGYGKIKVEKLVIKV